MQMIHNTHGADVAIVKIYRDHVQCEELTVFNDNIIINDYTTWEMLKTASTLEKLKFESVRLGKLFCKIYTITL